jgi:hypothetical protein
MKGARLRASPSRVPPPVVSYNSSEISFAWLKSPR